MNSEEVKQLVERLEKRAAIEHAYATKHGFALEEAEFLKRAASALLSLAQEREALREALKICANYQEPPGDQFSIPGTLKHVRAIARAALKDT